MSSRAWFRRLIPRPSTPLEAKTSGPPTRVVDVDLYRGMAGGSDWTAEWGLLDEQMVDEITTNVLAALVEQLEERDQELDAARAANRELFANVNKQR